jgi:ComF family protein
MSAVSVKKSNFELSFFAIVFIIAFVKSVLSSAIKIFAGLRQIVWQNCCRLCNTTINEDENYFCSECWRRLSSNVVDSYCLRCGRELSPYAKLPNGCAICQQEIFYFDSIACIGIYQEPLRSLIINFKLADRTYLLEPILNLVRNAAAKPLFSEPIDFIVPVPLHWLKRFQRGFNQSALIAKGLNIGSAKLNTDLVRIRYTQRQSELATTAKRKKNVEGAFAVRKNHNFSGKNICLVDDIKTTGATLNECAKVLKKDAGANKVFAFVLAVAGQNKDV